MQTYVHIDNLRIHAYHGVMLQERTVGNDYVVNLSVAYPWQEAMATDDVGDTLNYAELSDVVKKEMSVPSNLLEHVAGRIAKAIGNRFPKATSLRLRITKVAPPMHTDCDGAGVELSCDY